MVCILQHACCAEAEAEAEAEAYLLLFSVHTACTAYMHVLVHVPIGALPAGTAVFPVGHAAQPPVSVYYRVASRGAYCLYNDTICTHQ